MLRGRGTLEVNPSNNPFFQTTQSEIGYAASSSPNTKWKSPVSDMINEPEESFISAEEEAMLKEKESHDKGNFLFLYRRTSDTIGSKVKVNYTKPERKSKAEFLRECYKSTAALAAGTAAEPCDNSTTKIDTTAYLRTFKHVSKVEDPRYTTANNEIGKRAPTVATIVTERFGIPQDFSNSFNNVKPQNTRLNTGITRSNVHPYLDNQFA